ncbi:MAG: M4 family metallopeptidase [candidate division Zixibacteria bacterium]|nr:M4 family metallopeptidase [candidate division Zixibacteria bacterium]
MKSWVDNNDYCSEGVIARFDFIIEGVFYRLLPPGYRSGTRSIDIVAHEWTHGLTGFESDLWCENEPGALDESFSDMMGAYIASLRDPSDTNIWRIGENVYMDGRCVNNMKFPEENLHPSVYLGLLWYTDTDSQNNLVHTNNGVPSKMFYLLSEGGHYTDTDVTGIGIENAIKIMYEANCTYWSEYSGFHNALEGSFRAVLDIEDSLGIDIWGSLAVPVAQAWNAVNVQDNTCAFIPGDCDGDGIGGTMFDYIFLENVLFHGGGIDGTPLCLMPYNNNTDRQHPVALDINGDCTVTMADFSFFDIYWADAQELTNDDHIGFNWCPYFEPDLSLITAIKRKTKEDESK